MGMTESGMLSTLLSQMPEHLPGGVMIYRDSEKEEILYANGWLIDMFGCSSFDDFLEVTGGSFPMLVHPDDVERAEKDIRDQITGSRDKMDFVNYRIRRKDGTIKRVEEFGRRVFIPSVGPVFYVFFLDDDTKYRIYDIDALTGLPGKTRFLQHAAMTMAMASLDP